MEIYLDNSATTPICPEALSEMTHLLTEIYGNPSSIHQQGQIAYEALQTAREKLAKALLCRSDEIFFSPNGTIANNAAILSTAEINKRKGNRIVTTAIEHPSVMEPLKQLEKKGFEVVRLNADSFGKFNNEELFNAVNKDTILVSIMLVNNEIGTVFPVNLAKKAVAATNSPALIHCDAVQGFGKMCINPKSLGVDFMTFSAHKIHGPKGVGALYVRKGVRLLPLYFGGAQEGGYFSGTEPLPAIAGFGAAVSALPDIETQYVKIAKLRDAFISELKKIRGISINSPWDALPYIINFSVTDIPSQVLINYLSSKGIYISAGSACKKGRRSEVLVNIGLSTKKIDSSVRISLSRHNTLQELMFAIDEISNAVNNLGRFS